MKFRVLKETTLTGAGLGGISAAGEISKMPARIGAKAEQKKCSDEEDKNEEVLKRDKPDLLSGIDKKKKK